MQAFSLGDDKRVSFWKDVWCDEEALCLTFPTLYNMVDHKDTMVADVWDDNREDGGWLPIFLRFFNDWELEEMERFLYALHRQKINPWNDEKLMLKGSRDKGFSVKLMYKVIDQSPNIVFPFRSIWNPIVPPKMGFFT